MYQLITRKTAKEYGLKKYFTGKPCIRGNVSERYVPNKSCLCHDCRSNRSGKLKAWRSDTNFDDSDYQQRYYINNSEKRKENTKNWQVQNPIRTKSLYANKNGRRRQRYSKQIDDTELLHFSLSEAYQQCIDLKILFEVDFNIDHMIPLNAKNASGLHCVTNFQVIPKSLNLSKRNKLIYTEPFEWLGDCR